MSMMSDLHIQLLGGFQLRHDDQPVTGLHQMRLQSLLTYLILHRNVPESRQHLAFLFWPDTSEQQAYSNLRKVLHDLRRALPNVDSLLEIDTKTVQWRPEVPCVIDVAQFEAKLATADEAERAGNLDAVRVSLQEVVELYTGDLLPGCYDDWITLEREHLRDRLLDALARLADCQAQAQQYELAIRYAYRLLRLEPLREENYRRLMRLYAFTGEPAAALRIYHTCATTLQRDLGVEPSPLTHELYVQLFNLGLPTQPHSAVHKRELLVGRRVEWQQLLSRWQHAASGHACCLLITGEPGIGKSRLVAELAAWIRQQGGATAYARAYAAEGRLAYDPVAEWLRSLKAEQHLGKLEAVWLGEIGALVPELAPQHPQLDPAQAHREIWQRRHFFEACARAFRSVPIPLLLVLDDLQWCDQETLEWLHYLLRFDRRAPLLVVGTARPGEVDAAHPLHALVRELREADQVTEVELSPLTVEETTQLAQQVAEQPLTPEQTAFIFRMTEGNPLFVQEMVHADMLDKQPWGERSRQSRAPDLHAPLPVKLQSVIEARLARLSPQGRSLAELAATIGRSFTFTLLRQVSGEGEDKLVATLDELWQRRIVREQGSDGYDFSHDKIREVAYAGISLMRRRLLHRRVAQTLERIHAANLDLVSIQIAAHYRQAGDAAKAAAYYYWAGFKANFGFAMDETLSHLRQGLTMLQGQPRTAESVAMEIAMHLALGRLLTAREGLADTGACEAFETARHLCLESNNMPQLVRALDFLQGAYSARGNFQLALALAEESIEVAARLNNHKESERAHGGLGLLLCSTGDFASARAHLEHADALAASQSEVEADAKPFGHPSIFGHPGIFHYPFVLWLLGYPAAALRYLQKVLSDQDPHTSPFELVVAYEFPVMLHHWRREWHEMQVYARKMAAEAEQHEFSAYRWLGYLYATAASSALGEPNEGSAKLRQSIEALKAQGMRMYIPYALSLLAEVCMRAGEHIEASTALDQALAMSAETTEQMWTAETLRLRGDLLAGQGAVQEAEVAYQQALTVARSQQAKSLEVRAAVSLGRLWQIQGKSQSAHDLLAPIYTWFTEGFDTSDLKEAQALLAKLTV